MDHIVESGNLLTAMATATATDSTRSTTTRPGAWPDLEFVMTTIAGRDNTLGMPIYLLPIDLAQGVLVDETATATIRTSLSPAAVTGSYTLSAVTTSGAAHVLLQTRRAGALYTDLQRHTARQLHDQPQLRRGG